MHFYAIIPFYAVIQFAIKWYGLFEKDGLFRFCEASICEDIYVATIISYTSENALDSLLHVMHIYYTYDMSSLHMYGI